MGAVDAKRRTCCTHAELQIQAAYLYCGWEGYRLVVNERVYIHTCSALGMGMVHN